jgi:H+/Cl- antiporter ClcA
VTEGVGPTGGSLPHEKLGDFTTTWEILRLVPLALVVGALGAGVALALLDGIGFVTNGLYYHRLGVRLVSPTGSPLGAVALCIPIAGGLVVGLMARFGSEQVRGHGIPEAMERILINGSTVQPRLALLKPISSAVSIGSGGPFGAEGPIILTGGALGSIVGQLFHLTAAQRRALLVAGAAAGMSAVFGTPVAATLFGVELLAFEFKPRSMVPIGIAAATADSLRMLMAQGGLVAPQPLFGVPSHAPLDQVALLGAVVVGLACGLAAWLLTQAVYRSEDLFKKLTPYLHWMWWPLIGGLLIGVGGLIDHRALGVGYDSIHAELLGRLGVGALLLLFVVKLVIWSGALGSGTSGGILAPIFMMGAALGGILGHVLPGATPGTWALLGMAGGLGGVTRSPFTAVIFSLELTHDQNSLLALLVVATVSHLVSVLILRRSILTEKVARRGFHVMREYAVDPLEATFVREVMETDVFTVEPTRAVGDLYRSLPEGSVERRQRLYPVIDGEGAMVGLVPWSVILAAKDSDRDVRAVMVSPTTVAYADEVLRSVADRMVALGVGAIPVVRRETPGRLAGLVTQFDLLGRARNSCKKSAMPSACSRCTEWPNPPSTISNLRACASASSGSTPMTWATGWPTFPAATASMSVTGPRSRSARGCCMPTHATHAWAPRWSARSVTAVSLRRSRPSVTPVREGRAPVSPIWSAPTVVRSWRRGTVTARGASSLRSGRPR